MFVVGYMWVWEKCLTYDVVHEYYFVAKFCKLMKRNIFYEENINERCKNVWTHMISVIKCCQILSNYCS